MSRTVYEVRQVKDGRLMPGRWKQEANSPEDAVGTIAVLGFRGVVTDFVVGDEVFRWHGNGRVGHARRWTGERT